MNSCLISMLLLWVALNNSVDANTAVRSGRTIDEPTTTSLRVVQHLTRPVERIVDVKALDEIGGDALATEFIYHPPGHEANVNDYPFFAHWSHAMCGASIVHDDVLLTAGHCGRKALDPLWRKQVRLLSKYREQGGIVRYVAHLEVHTNYNQNVQEFDFQLIKVNSSMLVDDNGTPTGAQVIKLNRDPNNPQHGDPVQAVGFGTVTPDGHSGNSKVLMDATLQAFASDHCLKQYGPGKIVEEIMMCVGSVDGTVDTCQGDSGGPMLDKNSVQVAVVSWGEGCAQADRPGIGSRVSAVIDWIETQICRLSAHPPSSCKPEEKASFNHRLPSAQAPTPTNETFDLRVTVKHDDSPQETAWSLTHMDSFTLLYLQPFDSVPEPFVDISQQFQKLGAGRYFFEMGDSAQDGICCGDGPGSISISNQNNQVIWEHSGKFQAYLGVRLDISKDGRLVNSSVTTEYISPGTAATMVNSKKYVNDPQHNDKDWPGEYPKSQNSIIVNIKHDNRPYEVHWSVHYLKNTTAPAATQRVKDGDTLDKDGDALSGLIQMLPFLSNEEASSSKVASRGQFGGNSKDIDNQWTLIYESPESYDRLANTLETKTLEDLKPGLYQYSLRDSAGDGICCDYRFGWATLTTNTGKSDITGHHHQVLWEHDGEFSYKVQTTIKLTDKGGFEVVYSE